MDFLSGIVQNVLTIFYSLTGSLGFPNYGLAIILMTIAIKIILYPITAKQISSMANMAKIQPKMKELQEKYKNDKPRLNQELAELYKRENINPLAGCLPLLLQMPILIAIFYGIREYQYIGTPSFLWINSLADADPTYVLPVVSALTTYVQSKQTIADPNNPQNKIMLYFMPLFIGYISLTFPAGLVLYWVVTNIMQIGQQWLMGKNDPAKAN